MKMHALDRLAVNFGLRRSKTPEHGTRLLAKARCEIGLVDHRLDVFEMPMGLSFFDDDLYPRRSKSPTPGLADTNVHVVELQPMRQFLELFDRPAGGHESSQAHVAADAGEAIEVGELVFQFRFVGQRRPLPRLMR